MISGNFKYFIVCVCVRAAVEQQQKLAVQCKVWKHAVTLSSSAETSIGNNLSSDMALDFELEDDWQSMDEFLDAELLARAEMSPSPTLPPPPQSIPPNNLSSEESPATKSPTTPARRGVEIQVHHSGENVGGTQCETDSLSVYMSPGTLDAMMHVFSQEEKEETRDKQQQDIAVMSPRTPRDQQVVASPDFWIGNRE